MSGHAGSATDGDDAGSGYPTPTAGDVLRAHARIRPHLPRTPLFRHPALEERLGLTLWLKHENHHVIGSFKARGALNAVLAAEGDVTGVAASSSGNHGQGVAYAARTLGLPATIVVPEWANPEKLAVIRALGAEIVVHGTGASECNEHARRLAAERGLLLVDDFLDPHVVAGAGTVALEILEEAPDLDVLVIPLGGGALASGCGLIAKAVDPGIRTVGVQSEACQATYLSWREGRPVAFDCNSNADGLAVDLPEMALIEILRRVLDDVVLVTEDDLLRAIALLLETTHNLAEASGAAGVAAASVAREALGGTRIATILTGANINTTLLPEVLRAGAAKTGGGR